MEVYKAINAVQAELARDGIGKDRKNQMQNYSFRGIDDVFNALSPLLAKHGLCILPRILTRQCDERTTKKGDPCFFVTVEAEFDFVAASDGSKHVVRTFGEAMDSADKATNKAMSAAYKYAAFQAFAIPTEGDNDADAHTPQVTTKAAPKATPAPVATQAAPLKMMTEAQRKQVMPYFTGKEREWRLDWVNQWLDRVKAKTRNIKSFNELPEAACAALLKELETNFHQGAA